MTSRQRLAMPRRIVFTSVLTSVQSVCFLRCLPVCHLPTSRRPRQPNNQPNHQLNNQPLTKAYISKQQHPNSSAGSCKLLTQVADSVV
ncbi:hypothetical protein F4821DRAFT_179822 [Hypoxylon rubiginosum]|uniref:Uncharacterized protein n=1 Tax=Hypoxylon rubiginosum TaxID=110542 RepID=A0ACC0CUJ7_9PEZI|nr:hypothetical protein F4821DRAFT_179822 [Hypoxylon rubiginosum]